MEMHVSTDDFNYISKLYEEAKSSIEDVEGYACIYGVNCQGLRDRKYVYKGEESSIIPEKMSFGAMVDLMNNEGADHLLVFQREDWIGTDIVLTLHSAMGMKYLEKHYYSEMDSDYSKDSTVYKLPTHRIPYTPSAEDLFYYMWTLKQCNNLISYIEDNDDDELTDFVDGPS